MIFSLLTWKSRGGVLLKIEIRLVCLKGRHENLLNNFDKVLDQSWTV